MSIPNIYGRFTGTLGKAARSSQPGSDEFRGGDRMGLGRSTGVRTGQS
ncbi:MAG: hypothetical protein HC895_04605 [Leptolyngbyaceae cyanobacterium SM1_3_5]|nr:hypothetical protein [Leptolyngbyaceae cyanobacterium SM1_3_5]